VNITIYNSLGEAVKEVFSANLTAGEHAVEFSADDLSAGNYYYKLVTDKFVSTRSMIVKK
jgi:hypothetical protein